MNAPYYARLVARLLSRAPELPRASRSDARAAAISQIERALRDKSRRKQRTLRAVAALALFGVAAASTLIVRRSSDERPAVPRFVTARVTAGGDGARIQTASATNALHASRPLLPGNRLITDGASQASIELSSGTKIVLRDTSRLLFADAGPIERFSLAAGELLAQVAKLQRGERFIVDTPDAEIEVHGTIFRLAVLERGSDCADSAQTRLDVHEGIVQVRAHGETWYVRRGEHWPSHCETAISPIASDGPQALTSALVPTRGPERDPSAHSQQSPIRSVQKAPDDRSSSLIKEQNELFSRAVNTLHAGNSTAAIALFEELMQRFPSSPLAESAAAERMRTLAHTNRTAAFDAAREYLARYPRGFAARDAELLLGAE